MFNDFPRELFFLFCEDRPGTIDEPWTILFVGIVGSAIVQSQSIPKVIETATAAAPTNAR